MRTIRHRKSLEALVLKASTFIHIHLKGTAQGVEWPQESLELMLTELQGHIRHTAHHNGLSKKRMRRHASEMSLRLTEWEKATRNEYQVNWAILRGRTDDHRREFATLLEDWMTQRLYMSGWRVEGQEEPPMSYRVFTRVVKLLADQGILPFHRAGKLDGLSGQCILPFQAPDMYRDSGKGSKINEIVLRWGWDDTASARPRLTLIVMTSGELKLIVHGAFVPDEVTVFRGTAALEHWLTLTPNNALGQLRVGLIKRKETACETISTTKTAGSPPTASSSS